MLAKHWGVVIPDDIRFVFREDLIPKPRKRTDKETFATYGGFRSDKTIRWSDFYVGEKIPVKVRPSVLDSDEAIVAVLAHEMHELNALREMFDERETIDSNEIIRLIGTGVRGNLHDRAWDVADHLVRAMREGTRR